MPDLIHSLLKQDIGHLRIIAEFWGIELNSVDVDSAREELSASLLDFELLAELMESLSPQVDLAITDLVNSGGRIAWPAFTRKYGDIREMGAGKRDRERPHLKPSSTSEALFYRGILAKAFFETDKGSQEFAYIPDDLLLLIESSKDNEPPIEVEALGRPASPGEKGQEILANDSVLDDVTTLLAALRMGKSMDSASLLANTQKHTLAGTRASGFHGLLTSAKLIKKNTIQAEAVKAFFEAPRNEALKILQDAWVESTTFNELKLMPSIVCEGEWTNQPFETREFLLNLLDAIPEDKWWSLNSFIRDIKTKYADFQRPAGDYDSWFIKRASDGQFLRGFSYWDQVDGALIKYFITNILHWLGRVDLSIAEGATEVTAFRITSDTGRSTFDEKGKVSVSSNGKISVERTAPRVVRYQISRFCEWNEEKKDAYQYRITTNSLTKAKEQGLKAEQLLALLVKHTSGKVPPSLVQALKRWEVNGTEARVETQVILRLSRPEILEEMRKSKASKYLGEVLSPTAVTVKSGAIQKVMEALAELGVLAEINE
ncbi:MAG: helicase-associated domain-containing protein [Anaerolineales bacterium]|nr:helicase-associated domain-containing protein [Anaerolineales bacterium]